MNTSLILLAGGIGKRMGSFVPKQFLSLKDKPIALYSFELFSSMEEFFEIIIVCDKKYQHFFQGNNIKFATPGRRRQDSVFSGFQKTSKADLICIHDSARPFVEKSCIKKLLHTANLIGASALATPVTSTIKKCLKDNKVEKTLDRSCLMQLQTPQALKPNILMQGFLKATQDNITVTDDVALAELIHHPVVLTLGNIDNIKITTPFDLQIANTILNEKAIQINS